MPRHCRICVLLIGLLLLNACTSALAPLAPNQRKPPENGTVEADSASWTLAPPWVMSERAEAEAEWSAFEASVRESLGQHPSTARMGVSLLRQARIPGRTGSAVAVQLDNAGPYLTEIFAANRHALSDAGYETFADPALALPALSHADGAMLGYRIPGAAHGLSEDMVVLQYVLSTPLEGTYVMYSLTLEESIFAAEAETFRQWVLAMHAAAPGSTGADWDTGKAAAITGLTMPVGSSAFRAGDNGSGGLVPRPDQVGFQLPHAVQLSQPVRTARAPLPQRASGPAAASGYECGTTAYASGTKVVEPYLKDLPRILLGDDVTAEQNRTLRFNHGTVEDFEPLLNPDLSVEMKNRIGEALLRINMDESEESDPNHANILDRQGAKRTLAEHVQAFPKVWNFLGSEVQECLDIMPSEDQLSQGRETETPLETYDNCHDHAVQTLSLAISGLQAGKALIGAVMGAPAAGVGAIPGAVVGASILEPLSTAVDTWDAIYKQMRLAACFAGSPDGKSRFGQPAVKEGEDPGLVCSELMVDVNVSQISQGLPYLGTGMTTAAKTLVQSLSGRVSKSLPTISDKFRKIGDSFKGFLDRRPQYWAGRVVGEGVEGTKDGITENVLEHWEQLQKGEISPTEFGERIFEDAGSGAAIGMILPKPLVEGEGVELVLGLWEILKSKSGDDGDSASRGRGDGIPAVSLRPLRSIDVGHAAGPPPVGLTAVGDRLPVASALPVSSAEPAAGQPGKQAEPSIADLVYLSLFAISLESDGGPLFTERERTTLAALPLPPEVTEEERRQLLQTLTALSEGTADPGLMAGLEEILQDMAARVRRFQGALDVVDLQLAVTGAGLGTLELESIPGRRHAARAMDFLLVDRQTGLELRGVTDEDGLGDVLWLGPDRVFSLLYHDPASAQAAATSFRSGSEPGEWIVPPVLAGPVDPRDTDADGVPDLAEWVRGTNPAAGTPQDEWPIPAARSGVLGWTDTSGYALDVCTVRPGQVAVLDLTDGLSLFQASDAPVAVSRVSRDGLSGHPTSLHCNPYGSGRMLVETLAGDLWRVDADPAGTLGTPWMMDPTRAEDPEAPYWRTAAFAPSWVFAGDSRGRLRALALTDPPARDTGTGSDLDTTLLDLPDPIEGLAYQLDTLYLLTPRGLQAHHVEWSPGAPPTLHFLGRVWLAGEPGLDEWRRTLAVAGDRAWVGGVDGLAEVNVADPLAMEVRRRPHPDHGMIQDLVPLGGHTLLAVTQFSADSVRFLALMDTDPRQPRVESVYLWPSPGRFKRLAMLGERVFAAAGTHGLATLNVPGIQSTPPLPVPVVRTNFAPGRWEQGQPLLVHAALAQRTFLYRVEIRHRGELVASDASPPFELAVGPEVAGAAGAAVELELTLTDSRGLVAAVPLALDVVADARPPRLLAVAPRGPSLDYLAEDDRILTLSFSEPVVLDASDQPPVRLLRRDTMDGGRSEYRDVNLDPETVDGGAVIRIPLPPDLEVGDYVLATHAELRDTAGNYAPRVWAREYALHASFPSSLAETRAWEEKFAHSPDGDALYQDPSAPGPLLFREMPLELAAGGANLGVGLPDDLPVGKYLLVPRPELRDAGASTLEIEANGMDPTTWKAAVPVGTDAGQAVAITGASGALRDLLTPILVGPTSLPARSTQRASLFQAQRQAVQVPADGPDDNAEELFAAVNAKDVEKVRQLQVAGTDPSARIQESWTVPHQASRLDNMRLGTMTVVTERPLTTGITTGGMVLWPETMPVVQNHAIEEVKEPILWQKALSSSRSKAVGRMSNQAQEEDDTTLLEAVGRNDTERVRALLATGANPNERTDNNQTPLHLASEQGHTLLAEILLEHGAEANARMNDGMTPLLFASQNGHVPTIKILLSHGAEVSAQHLDGWTPLHVAAHRNRVEAVKVLLAYGADVHIRNNEGKTPLYDAVAGYWGRHVEAARVLLAAGADPNARKSDGMSPLHDAAQGGDGHVDMIRLLLAHGAEVNARHPDGWTALHAAAHRNHVEAVEVLLAYGADVHACNDSGKTPLYDAVAGYWGRHVEAARVLLAAGADPNARKSDGMSPLIDAAQGGDGHVEMLRLLLAHGADVNAQVPDGWTALHAAAARNHVEAVEVLLTHGADARIRNKWGKTPLYDAVAGRHVEAARVLLAAGADPNARKSDGMPPLIDAAQGGDGHVEMIRLLLANGAEVNARVPDGWTALHVAATRNHVEAVEVLLAHGADVRIRNRWGKTPLYDAVAGRHVEAARVLLAAGADPNARKSDGMPPLIDAAQGGDGHVEIIRLLLANGAEVNARVPDGWTALHVAATRNHVEAVEVLLAHGADVRIRNRWGKTPLYDAVAGRHVEAARVLLAAGADPNARKSDGMPPLIDAAQGGDGHVEMIRLLLANGAEVNARHPDSWTALHVAATRNHVEAVEVLLAHGADVRIRNRWGKTPLYDAVAGYGGRHVEAARVLLAHGADPNVRRSDGMTPLIDAAHGGDNHVEMIRLLLANGAEVNARHPDGRTALDVAKERGQEDAVAMLLAHGADLGDSSD